MAAVAGGGAVARRGGGHQRWRRPIAAVAAAAAAAIRGGGGGPRRRRPSRRRRLRNRSGGRHAARFLRRPQHDRSGPRASRDYSGDRGRYSDRNRGDNRRYADRGRDNNHNNHNNRHRVWRNGAWVWIYGPDYYYDNYAYGGDCYWLRQQAYATGSPYWWSRYNACVGYY